MGSVPECFYRVSVKALVFNDQGRFLLTKKENGWRDFPGGGIDHGEDPKDALRREIKEEMGLEIKAIANLPSYFLTGARRSIDSYFANIFYKTTVKDYDVILSEECVEWRFFSMEEVRSGGEKFYFTIEHFIQEYY